MQDVFLEQACWISGAHVKLCKDSRNHPNFIYACLHTTQVQFPQGCLCWSLYFEGQNVPLTDYFSQGFKTSSGSYRIIQVERGLVCQGLVQPPVQSKVNTKFSPSNSGLHRSQVWNPFQDGDCTGSLMHGLTVLTLEALLYT